MMGKFTFIAVVSLSAIVSLCITSRETDNTASASSSSSSSSSASATVSFPASSFANLTPLDSPLLDQNSNPPDGLVYDFYQSTCPHAEQIVKNFVNSIVATDPHAAPQLLRLMFHDCFIEGCDASALIVGGNGTTTERDALPNKTLRGFQIIDMIKEAIEEDCPGIVSCADILVLSVRDGIFMSGGPFYPISTGRRDSPRSYQVKAEAEIPRPMNNVSEFLRLFSLRGFDEREVTALLGGHHIGHIGCQFINPRFVEFNSSSPDPSMEPSFFEELRSICSDNNTAVPNRRVPPQIPQEQESESFITFDGQYYRNLIAGKGILFADQQLMTFEKTLQVVQEYASDHPKFRLDFARAMVKLSNLGVLTGSQGEIRLNCSVPLSGIPNISISLKKKKPLNSTLEKSNSLKKKEPLNSTVEKSNSPKKKSLSSMLEESDSLKKKEPLNSTVEKSEKSNSPKNKSLSSMLEESDSLKKKEHLNAMHDQSNSLKKKMKNTHKS